MVLARNYLELFVGPTLIVGPFIDANQITALHQWKPFLQPLLRRLLAVTLAKFSKTTNARSKRAVRKSSVISVKAVSTEFASHWQLTVGRRRAPKAWFAPKRASVRLIPACNEGVRLITRVYWENAALSKACCATSTVPSPSNASMASVCGMVNKRFSFITVLTIQNNWAECRRKVCQIGERCENGLCIRVEGSLCSLDVRDCGEEFECQDGAPGSPKTCRDMIKAINGTQITEFT